jgi:hypothetical protein
MARLVIVSNRVPVPGQRGVVHSDGHKVRDKRRELQLEDAGE